MDRIVVDGELTAAAASPRGEKLCYALATRADDPAIRRLLRENPMRGAISLALEREPDYFRGTDLAGAEDTTLLAFEGGRLRCMGHCSTRRRWLNGQIRRVGYLGALRLDATAAGRVDILRRGYEAFDDARRASPADFYFTSIAADNVRARRLLERGLRGLPRYDYLTDFTTLVIPTAGCAGRPPLTLGAAHPDELATFLNAAGRHTQLAAAWTPDDLRALSRHDLPLDQIRVLRDDRGEITATAALWDQRGFRQTVIRGYAPALTCVRPAVNALARLFARPDWHLPRPHSILAHAFVSPLHVAAGHERLLAPFLAALGHEARERGIAYLTLGFSSGHPLLAIVRERFRARAYLSRLYRVRWPGEPDGVLEPFPFLPEVALL